MATAYVPLGDTARVLHYTGDIDPAVEQANSDWSRALVRLDIATAVLRQKDADLEQALALGGEALRMCADHPIRSVWQRATTLHQLTQRWANEPRVIEFADQLRTWRGRAESTPSPEKPIDGASSETGRYRRMGTSYSSTFPAAPPADPDDPTTVARHDQAAFEQVDQMLCHWDRPHRPSYHWTVTLVHEPRAVELSRRCQALLPNDGLDLVPPGSLHLTVRRFGYVDVVPIGELETAVATVSEHCRETSPFDLHLLPLAGSPGALRFSVAPWSPLLSLHRAVSAASGYDEVDPLTLYRPHVGVAYSSRMQAPGPFVAAAREARSLPSTKIAVTGLQLVELYRADHQYRWHVLERLPLAGTTTSCPHTPGPKHSTT